jgi:hypothetical protein
MAVALGFGRAGVSVSILVGERARTGDNVGSLSLGTDMVTTTGAVLAGVIFAAVLGGCVGSPTITTSQSGNQPPADLRLDQPSRPAATPVDSPPTLDNPVGSGAPAAGSFPRSFLIPGTDTSIHIGGFVDATGAGRFGQ